MQIRSIGIDLGKTTFHLIVLGMRSQRFCAGKDGSALSCSDAARTTIGIQRPRVVLPDKVRNGLHRRLVILR